MDKVIFTSNATAPNILLDVSLEMGNKGLNNLVKRYSSLSLIHGYELKLYIVCNEIFVYAMPIDSKIKDEDIRCKVEQGGLIKPIAPKEALDSSMEAIDGDRSALSYLQAAILSHEISEYGAQWHGTSWSHHIILPVYYVEEAKHEWIMYEEEPEIINPHFYYDKAGNPTIVFYTIGNLGTISLDKYKHTFSKENYSSKVECREIGRAGMGYVI